ncbi:MAG: mannose-1-phosphate guanylyltransferase [Caldilineaceae bacterium]
MSNQEAGSQLYVAILAGGVGTRLWPGSRSGRPKQFSDLTGSGSSLIQATVDRLDGVASPEQIVIVTGAQYGSLISQQLPFLAESQMILEPSGRNTAPAVGLAALYARRRNPNAILASLHSDHVIADTPAFQNALCCAAAVAKDGYIVTLGILPTSAHTGFGYIERGKALAMAPNDCTLPVYTVNRFLEKPSQEVAEEFFLGGAHYWNAGIFVARADRFLAEYKRQQPALYAALEAIDALEDRDLSSEVRRTSFVDAWHEVPSISIDHGIMERAADVAVIPLDAGWNDVGSWDALDEVLPATQRGNLVVRGKLIDLDSSNNIVSSDRALVALIGVHDMVVVDTGDAVLIGRKEEMQRVREIVDRLAEEGFSNLL